MHERNRYREPPDFAALALQYQSLAPFVKVGAHGRAQIDFQNKEAVRQVTFCLLQRDFNLLMHLPEETLCPIIPVRLNYILWIEDLLQRPGLARGIDIGTGASCIYPLLACRSNGGWTMVGSDINSESIRWASENASINMLQDRISLQLVSGSSVIADVLDAHEGLFDFCMCNPPFYESADQMAELASKKTGPPPSFQPGASHELITEGGEVAFIKRLIEESERYKTRVRWFTCKVGIRSNLTQLHRYLKSSSSPLTAITTTTFEQGQTTRWAIAWSFTETIQAPKTAQKRKAGSSYSREETFASTTIADLTIKLKAALQQFDLEPIQQDNEKMQVIVRYNTWNRRARRQQQQQQQHQRESSSPLFSFTISVQQVADDCKVSMTFDGEPTMTNAELSFEHLAGLLFDLVRL